MSHGPDTIKAANDKLQQACALLDRAGTTPPQRATTRPGMGPEAGQQADARLKWIATEVERLEGVRAEQMLAARQA